MKKIQNASFLIAALCCLLWAAAPAVAAQITSADVTSRDMSTFNRLSPGKPYARLDASRAACLLVDHQTGLFSLVQDAEPAEFKNNVLALAAVAKFFNLPTILSTSLEEGPNGPLLPEIRAIFPDAPIIHRPGQINAWDNEDFVAAVGQTGRDQLLIAGIVTDVCVAHVALSAIEAGYEVFVVTDASGTFNTAVRDAAWNRMTANGAQLVNWFSVACELHRDWRNDMEGLAGLLAKYLPAYGNLITSHGSAREAATATQEQTSAPR